MVLILPSVLARLTFFADLLMSEWSDSKHFFERSVSVSPDSLHVAGGVLILLGAAIVLGKPMSSWRPWLALLALICFNEFIDLHVDQWKDRPAQYGESFKDLILTMALPTFLLLFARLFPRMWSNS
jgi:hypothetical protein